jgi:alcohol dehydrogenase class IV
MMEYVYSMPTKVVFGGGSCEKVGEEIKALGCIRPFLVTGKNSMRETGILKRVMDCLGGLDVVTFESVESDPSTDTVDLGVSLAKDCDSIIGLGGGSALDAAKAISIVASCGGGARDYLSGGVDINSCLPVVAIPTTAGTASEVTAVSVLSDREMGIKKSFRNPQMYPKTALIDYTLTFSTPPDVTASAGLDALTHAIESMTSTRAQPIPNSICLESARLAIENLKAAYQNPCDEKARENMMQSSVMAGFGITHSGAGLCHGLSYAIWRITGRPHGLICGMLLPHVMRYNVGHEGGVYDRLARYCGVGSTKDLIEKISQMNEDMNVSERLSEWGVKEEDIVELVEYGLGGSTQTNPRRVESESLAEFIETIL